jgi:hypothetical protein
MMSRLSLVGIGLIYLVFFILFLTGTGTEGPHDNATGVLIFALFALSLILHTALVISARSWAIGMLSMLSVCVLFVSLFWVLHSVTGESL